MVDKSDAWWLGSDTGGKISWTFQAMSAGFEKEDSHGGIGVDNGSPSQLCILFQVGQWWFLVLAPCPKMHMAVEMLQV